MVIILSPSFQGTAKAIITIEGGELVILSEGSFFICGHDFCTDIPSHYGYNALEVEARLIFIIECTGEIFIECRLNLSLSVSSFQNGVT